MAQMACRGLKLVLMPLCVAFNLSPSVKHVCHMCNAMQDWTPLMVATFEGFPLIVDMLISNEADVELTNNHVSSLICLD